MPDDFFRVRLVCVLLDTCGMCFDRGSQGKKMDNFLTFFQYYVLCKNELPMDVDFMLSDSLEALRPKLVMFKTVEEAAGAVDEMLNSAFHAGGVSGGAQGGEDSGEESGDEEDERRGQDEEEEEEGVEPSVCSCLIFPDVIAHVSQGDERAASPDEVVVVSHSSENVGPTDDEDADFARELAKMVTDVSSESRKVDKKTALALWDQAVVPPGIRKKRAGAEGLKDDEGEASSSSEAAQAQAKDHMKFMFITKKGNKPQARELAVPSESALAVQTQTAQMQEKVEQQHLKRLVLNYEQREEAEEMKGPFPRFALVFMIGRGLTPSSVALEQRYKGGAIKIRYAG